MNYRPTFRGDAAACDRVGGRGVVAKLASHIFARGVSAFTADGSTGTAKRFSSYRDCCARIGSHAANQRYGREIPVGKWPLRQDARNWLRRLNRRGARKSEHFHLLPGVDGGQANSLVVVLRALAVLISKTRRKRNGAATVRAAGI